MPSKERALLNSCAGAIWLSLLVLGAFAWLGPRPIWQANPKGYEEFDPMCALAMAAAIPFGASVGPIWNRAWRIGAGHLAVSWLMGCFGGAVAYLQIVWLTGYFDPLGVSGFGLPLAIAAWWLIRHLGAPKPIPRL